MSPKKVKPPQAAFCDDFDEDLEESRPETRVFASANVAAKRSSRPELTTAPVVNGSIASDSGYSSRATTVDSGGSQHTDPLIDPHHDGLRVDTTFLERERRPYASERRPDPTRRRSSSQAPQRSQSISREEPGGKNEQESSRDREYAEEAARMEKVSRRIARDGHRRSPKEATRPQRSHTPPTENPHPTAAQPRMRRSGSHRARPTTMGPEDFARLGRQSFSANGPPISGSIWGHVPQPTTYIPTSPQTQPYMLPSPQIQTFQYMAFEQPRPAPPPLRPLARRSTVYSTPIVQYVSTTPIVYSSSPIQDRRVPQYQHDRPREPVSQRPKRDEDTRRMPPPSMRPMVPRGSTTPTVVQGERSISRPRHTSSRRPSDAEPASASVQRPPNRKSVSYHHDTKRHSIDDSRMDTISRRATVDGHEGRGDLEDKIQYSEKYQRAQEPIQRVPLTTETVKRNAPRSSARSHSSRGSGHKSSSTTNSHGITVLTGKYRINVLDPDEKGVSFKTSKNGVQLQFEGDAEDIVVREKAKIRESGDAGGVLSKSSIVSKISNLSKKSDRSNRKR